MRLAPHCAVFWACVLGHAAVRAETLPAIPPGGDAGTLMRRAEPLLQRPQDAAPLPDWDKAQSDVPRSSSAVAFVISGYRLEGVSQGAWARALQNILQAYVTDHGTLAQAQAAAQAVSNWYRARGYFLARAYVPPQNIRDGVVHLVVQEGMMDPDAPVLVARSDKAKTPRFRKSLAAALMADQLDVDAPVQRARVESALLSLNDMAGIRAQAQFQPGNQPGTTRLLLRLEDRPLLAVYGGYDSYGAELTGRQRFHGALMVQNPSGFGDALRAQISVTRENYLYGRVDYTMPLGLSGLVLGGGYGALRYKIGGSWALLQAGGRAQSWDVRLRWPLLRQRMENFTIEGGYQQERLRNMLGGNTTSDRSLHFWRIGIEAMRAYDFAGGGQWTLGLEGRQATLDLSALPMILAADQGPWGGHMHGPFRTLMAQARLYHIILPQQKIALELEGEGQWSNRILDSAAKFQLGGPEGVRAYANGEGAGDKGWRARANLHWYWAQNQGPHKETLRFSAYYDYGLAKPYQLMPGQVAAAHHDLQGWGLSLAASWSNKIFLSLHHARALGENAFADAQGLDSEGSRRRARNWLSLSVMM